MVFGYTPAGLENYFRIIGLRTGERRKDLTSENWTPINAEVGVIHR